MWFPNWIHSNYVRLYSKANLECDSNYKITLAVVSCPFWNSVELRTFNNIPVLQTLFETRIVWKFFVVSAVKLAFVQVFEKDDRQTSSWLLRYLCLLWPGTSCNSPPQVQLINVAPYMKLKRQGDLSNLVCWCSSRNYSSSGPQNVICFQRCWSTSLVRWKAKTVEKRVLNKWK